MKAQMKTHIRIIFIWTVSLALLWLFLFLRNGNVAPLGVTIAQAAPNGDAVYFDEEMPVFEPLGSEETPAATSGRVASSAQNRPVGATPQRTAQTGKSAPTAVNINTAGLNELTRLPGIGPAMAQRIIDYRNEHGNFANVEEVKNVRGIGVARFNSMKDFLRL